MQNLYIIKQNTYRYEDTASKFPEEIKVITTKEKAIRLAKYLNGYFSQEPVFYVEGEDY